MNKEQRKRYEKLLAMAIRTTEEQTECDALDTLKLSDMKREALIGVSHTRNLSVLSTRVDDLPANTLSFVFVSDDNAGTRYDWFEDQYYTEQLDINGATSERLNTFFKDHLRNVDSAIGKITNVRVVDAQLVGDVTFGTDEDSQRVFSKYSEGILTDVSIGYEIRDYNVEQGAENELDTVTVTRFDIFEVSAVGIGFDSKAKKRDKLDDMEFIMNKEERERLAQLLAMTERTAEQVAELTKLSAKRDADTKADSDKRDAEMATLKAENAEMKRVSDVEAVVRDFGDKGVSALASFGADAKPSAEQVRLQVQKAFVGEAQNLNPANTDTNARGQMIDDMVDGLALRVGAKIDNPTAGAEQYRFATLTSIANALLPESERSFNPSETADRSLVTGDFPLLLQSVGARVLTAEFEALTGTYKAWMKEVDVPDFRTMQDLTTSFGGGRLSKTLENGDLKEISGAEAKEQWNIETFGNKFTLTREMLINDDLGAFTSLISTFGEMARTTSNGMAYDILQGKVLKSDGVTYVDYKMADGSGLYIAGRNNTTTTALTSEALSAGRLKMSKHKSIDGKTPLRITPKFLIVPPALEVTAKEILGALSKLGADNVNVPNVNQNSYELIVDPEISSDTAWYLLAERRTFKMGFLQGTNRSPVIKKNDSSVMRVSFEGVFDIGVMAEDYKGLFRGNV